jgi:membrane protease YdiL (CAAX protease family)
MIRTPVDTVTGSGAFGAGHPPVVGPPFRRPVTLLAVLVVALFTALVAGLVVWQSRLEQQNFPEASLGLVVGRTMDVRFIVDRQSRWERAISYLLMDEAVVELAQAIAWYEELATHSREPGVDLQLAILEGEAGRKARLGEKLEGWDVRPDPYPAMAATIAAAYLDDESREGPEDEATEVPANGQPWFGEQLAYRLALQRGDQAQAAEIIAERVERTAPLVHRVRAFTAIEVALLVAAVAAALAVATRRCRLLLGSAMLPPPWSGRMGAIVLVRGAAVQVLLLVVLYAVSQAADSAILDALTWPWSNLFFLPMLVLARQHLVRPSALRLRDAFGIDLEPGTGGRLTVIVLALIGFGLAGDWISNTLGMRLGRGSHWTEWFDEDLVWGAGADAALAIISAVVFAPFFEEIVFRGLLFATFRRRFGFLASAVASSLIFAVAHGYGWVGLASVLWSGVLWSWSYERTRSLLPGMLAHAAVNLLASLGLLLLLR